VRSLAVALVVTAYLGTAVGSEATGNATRASATVAYLAREKGGLIVRARELAGGDSRDLAAGNGIQGWSRDGSELIFYRSRGPTLEVFAVSNDRSSLKRIVALPVRGFRSLSPDRGWTATVDRECVRLQRPPQIRIRSVDGHATYSFPGSDSTHVPGWIEQLVWSPTRRQVAYIASSTGNEDCRGLYVTSEIHTAGFTGSRRRLLSHGSRATSLVYSHDGRKLAAKVDCGGDTPVCGDIAVFVDGKRKIVTPTSVDIVSNLIWSHDGNELFAIVSDPLPPTELEPTHLRLVALDVRAPHVRTIATVPNSSVTLEALSSDGSTIALRYGRRRLWTVSTAGGPLRRFPWPPPHYDGSAAVFLP